MRNLFLIIGLACGLFINAQELKLENLETKAYKFEFPSEWIKEKQVNGDLYLYPAYDFNKDRPFGVSICRITDIDSPEDAGEEYLTMLMTSLARFKGAKITNQEIREVHGLNAFVFEYEANYGETHELGKVFIFRKGSKAYQITINGDYAAFKDFQMFGELIGNSFQLL